MINKELILGSPVAWRWKWHNNSEWQYGTRAPNNFAAYYKLQPLYVNPLEPENE